MSITENGASLVRGEAVFRYRRDTLRKGAKSVPGRQKAEVAKLSEGDAGLFAALKDLRLSIARERGVPAYVVFQDRALSDMARRKPRNETEFAEVFGVGKARLRDFSAPFLDLIAEYADGDQG